MKRIAIFLIILIMISITSIAVESDGQSQDNIYLDISKSEVKSDEEFSFTINLANIGISAFDFVEAVFIVEGCQESLHKSELSSKAIGTFEVLTIFVMNSPVRGSSTESIIVDMLAESSIFTPRAAAILSTLRITRDV